MRLFISAMVIAICMPCLVHAQTKIIDIRQREIYNSDTNADTAFQILVILLPEKNFADAKIVINKRLTLAFACSGQDVNCYQFSVGDIDSGRITLRFKDKRLIAVSGRRFLYEGKVLGDSLTSVYLSGRDKYLDTTITFAPPGKMKSVERANESLWGTSVLCEKQSKNASMGGLADFSFLCAGKNAEACKCGNLISQPYEDAYLPACFDKNGNAVSVNTQVIYNMTENDGLKKIYLIKINNHETPLDCGPDRTGKYEYRSVQKHLWPAAGDLMAISVIAPKDSVIIIDSNYVSYFLDSAGAAQKQFNASGNNPEKAQTETTKGNVPDSTKGVPKSIDYSNLKGCVTLAGDLISFNAEHEKLSFLQEQYNAGLACMQKKIVDFFKLSYLPRSGKSLSEALAAKLLADEIEKQYYNFACGLLNRISGEYDSALARKGNLRMFTQIIQVPNADEITIGMKTKNGTSKFYSHNFMIKGGLKIDFSSGLFATGLNDRDFVLRSVRLKFANAGPGQSADTTGNVIQKNSGKLTLYTGLMVHIYKRSGTPVNHGLVSGVTLNNGDFTWLLGYSVMFRSGSSRFSLAGGLALGKQKELDANHRQYLIKDSEINSFNGDRNNVPRFFTETNISTYEKRQVSWFAGITYNFASIKL